MSKVAPAKAEHENRPVGELERILTVEAQGDARRVRAGRDDEVVLEAGLFAVVGEVDAGIDVANVDAGEMRNVDQMARPIGADEIVAATRLRALGTRTRARRGVEDLHLEVGGRLAFARPQTQPRPPVADFDQVAAAPGDVRCVGRRLSSIRFERHGHGAERRQPFAGSGRGEGLRPLAVAAMHANIGRDERGEQECRHVGHSAVSKVHRAASCSSARRAQIRSIRARGRAAARRGSIQNDADGSLDLEGGARLARMAELARGAHVWSIEERIVTCSF